MGMYTELFISARIVNDPVVIETLKYMIGSGSQVLPNLPDHPLFKTERWHYMLRCTSYYFTPAVTHVLEWDDIGNCWSFINLSNFKNYDNELAHFVDWLTPYVEAYGREMIGYSRYEECDEPTIIYTPDTHSVG